MRRVRRDIGVRELVKGVVAKRALQDGEIVAQGGEQAGAVSAAIEVEAADRFCFFADEKTRRSFIREDGALKAVLQSGQGHHAASLRLASARSATWRAASSSAINSGSAGMWSSRSIIVGTAPKRVTA